jgi:hypothetical protein
MMMMIYCCCCCCLFKNVCVKLLCRAMFELCEDCVNDGVTYVEVRFSPGMPINLFFFGIEAKMMIWIECSVAYQRRIGVERRDGGDLRRSVSGAAAFPDHGADYRVWHATYAVECVASIGRDYLALSTSRRGRL